MVEIKDMSIYEPYNEYLNKFGFGAWMIDFSDVGSEDCLALCEFIKSRVENRN